MTEFTWCESCMAGAADCAQSCVKKFHRESERAADRFKKEDEDVKTMKRGIGEYDRIIAEAQRKAENDEEGEEEEKKG